MTQFRDITDLIEQLEAFEDRAGVRLEALFCGIDGPDSDDEYSLTVNGEMHAIDGTSIDNDIDLTMSVYDDRGRVIETQTDFVNSEDFFAFHTFSFTLFIKLGNPRRIRVYPKIS